jgi:DNA-binding transcriptional ArsR family regulator
MSLGGTGAGREKAALRAMAHPVRLRIMSLLTGTALTAADVARELGLTHANASYHLRNLCSAGMIVVAGEEKIRGGVAKRYRYDATRDHVPSTPEQKRAFFAALGNELIRRSAAGRFTEKVLIGDGDFWVDPEKWREIRSRFGLLVDELHAVALPPRTPGAIRTSTTVAMFEMEWPAGESG